MHDVCMGSKKLSAPKTGMLCFGMPTGRVRRPSAAAAVAAQQMLPALLLPSVSTRVEHVCAHIAQSVSAALAVDRLRFAVFFVVFFFEWLLASQQTLPPSWITFSLHLIHKNPLLFRLCSAGGGACGGGGRLAKDSARDARTVGPARNIRRVLHLHCLFRLLPFSAFCPFPPFALPVTDFQGATSSRAADPAAIWHTVGRQRRQRCCLLTQRTAHSTTRKCGAMLVFTSNCGASRLKTPCHDLSQQHSGGGCSCCGGGPSGI